MRTIRVLLHSLMLTWIGILSILVGFALYKVVDPSQQVMFQAPVAALLSVSGFALWSWLVRRFSRTGLVLEFGLEYLATYLIAFLWAPILFIPLHYFTQGYLTSFSNIEVIWLFQGPVDALALFTGMLVWREFPKILRTR